MGSGDDDRTGRCKTGAIMSVGAAKGSIRCERIGEGFRSGVDLFLTKDECRGVPLDDIGVK